VLRHNLQLPSELVAMTRAITIAEGTGMMLYPGLPNVPLCRAVCAALLGRRALARKIMPRVGQAASTAWSWAWNCPAA
jgi:hypothetical protein